MAPGVPARGGSGGSVNARRRGLPCENQNALGGSALSGSLIRTSACSTPPPRGTSRATTSLHGLQAQQTPDPQQHQHIQRTHELLPESQDCWTQQIGMFEEPIWSIENLYLQRTTFCAPLKQRAIGDKTVDQVCREYEVSPTAMVHRCLYVMTRTEDGTLAARRLRRIIRRMGTPSNN